MFDRWRKLGKAFYSEKRGQFDISKARCGLWPDSGVLSPQSCSAGV